MGDIPKVYKVVVELESGELVSRTAGGRNWTAFKSITYKEGEVAYAPEGGLGLFVDTSIDEAKVTAGGKSGGKVGVKVIHEAIPLGKQLECVGLNFDGMTRYPAILLGKEVWRETPRPGIPESKFAIGENVTIAVETGCNKSHPTDSLFIIKRIEWGGNDYCHSHWHYYGTDSDYEAPADESWLIATPRPEPKFKLGDMVKAVSGSEQDFPQFTIGLIHWGDDTEQFKGHKHWHYGKEATGYYHPGGYFVDEVYLELAPPEPVWVDVTRDCTFTPWLIDDRCLIVVNHGGGSRLWIGCNGVVHPVDLAEVRDYKLEHSGKYTADGAEYLKIMRRLAELA